MKVIHNVQKLCLSLQINLKRTDLLCCATVLHNLQFFAAQCPALTSPALVYTEHCCSLMFQVVLHGIQLYFRESVYKTRVNKSG